MKKKSTIAVIAVLAALAIAVAVLAVLNSKTAAEKKPLLRDASFVILDGRTADGTELARVSAADIEALGLREIEANYKKSGKEPETRHYTGVPFAEILRARGIDPAAFGSAVFSAADGYASALPIEKALDEENCFIVIDHGDEGPLRMVLPKDRFSQNWCKMLTDVTLK